MEWLKNYSNPNFFTKIGRNNDSPEHEDGVDSVGGARHEQEDVGRQLSGLAHQPEDESQHDHVHPGKNVLG